MFAVHVLVAGVGSALPAASIARTRNVCGPAVIPVRLPRRGAGGVGGVVERALERRARVVGRERDRLGRARRRPRRPVVDRRLGREEVEQPGVRRRARIHPAGEVGRAHLERVRAVREVRVALRARARSERGRVELALVRELRRRRRVVGAGEGEARRVRRARVGRLGGDARVRRRQVRSAARPSTSGSPALRRRCRRRPSPGRSACAGRRLRFEYVFGEAQAAYAALSSEHSKVAAGSFEENVNVALVLGTVPDGPLSMVVAGGPRVRRGEADHELRPVQRSSRGWRTAAPSRRCCRRRP